MKTLAQYLAEYLDQEVIVAFTAECSALDIEGIKAVIVDGMDAYMSTENCEIIISPL